MGLHQAKVVREHLNRANKMLIETQLRTKRSASIYFDYAEVFLQIAIVSASVSVLAASRPMFWFSLGLASLGGLETVNGFLLLVRFGFLHAH